MGKALFRVRPTGGYRPAEPDIVLPQARYRPRSGYRFPVGRDLLFSNDWEEKRAMGNGNVLPLAGRKTKSARLRGRTISLRDDICALAGADDILPLAGR